MSAVLQRILYRVRRRVRVAQARTPIRSLAGVAAEAPPPRPFIPALLKRADDRLPALIAELKQASPSKGVIRPNLNVSTLAPALQNAGAAALSILTEPDFFQGAPQRLPLAGRSCSIPLLRKDFIIDPWQVHQSRALGADAVLLIIAALPITRLLSLARLSLSLGMHVLVEAHSPKECRAILSLPFHRSQLLAGVNARNLNTFQVDLNSSLQCVELLASHNLHVVAESGVTSPQDMLAVRRAGALGALVGETLMRDPNPEQAARRLLSSPAASPLPS